jgi:saccharopine dehydrogenase-like NADP-dependent oxidoreductase
LEAFYTKGGLGLSVPRLKEKGLLNYSYRTIRYQGHVNLLKFLLEECCLSADAFEKALISATPPITEDKVIIKIKYLSKCGTMGVCYSEIKHDKNWTAMQKATSFPTAVVAGMMHDDKFNSKSYSLNYGHLSGKLFNEFREKLKTLDFSLSLLED